MALYRFDDRVPEIGAGCYIADSAEVIGDVRLGEGVYVGSGAVLRGDYGTIRIGPFSAVEEMCLMHSRPGTVCTVGSWVTLGHGCIVHGAELIDDYAVIGMGAVVSDFSVVGSWAAVGEGGVVRSRQQVPAGAVAVGVPVKVVGETTAEWRAFWQGAKEIYAELARTYPSRLVRLPDGR